MNIREIEVIIYFLSDIFEYMTSQNLNGGWYVAYTMPRHESKVSGTLLNLGVTNFLPKRKVLRVQSHRKKYIEAPLFPSYLFVYLENTENYIKCLNLDGILYFIRQGDRIAKVRNDVIEQIRLATDFASEIEISSHRFEEGCKMSIRKGPFAGMLCEIVNHNSKNKILVRVNLLQRNLLLHLDSTQFLD